MRTHHRWRIGVDGTAQTPKGDRRTVSAYLDKDDDLVVEPPAYDDDSAHELAGEFIIPFGVIEHLLDLAGYEIRKK